MEIPSSLLLCLAFSTVVAIGLPVVLAAAGKIRWRAAFPLRAVAVGALCFAVGALFLENILHSAVFMLFPGLAQSPWAYTAYGCLAAGVFEETARYVGLRLLCRGGRGGTVPTALAYGVGHGGLESLLLVGASLLSSLMTLVAVNGLDRTTLVQMMGGESQADTLLGQLEALVAAPAWQNLLSGYERVIALALHVSLSVLVWMVVTGRLPRGFMLAAVLLHALVNVPAGLAQTGILENLLLVEGLVTLATGLAVGYTAALYSKSRAVSGSA